MEAEKCVCGHGAEYHAGDDQPKCAAVVDPGAAKPACYCPRFIPAPPPPGTLANEGKKASLR